MSDLVVVNGISTITDDKILFLVLRMSTIIDRGVKFTINSINSVLRSRWTWKRECHVKNLVPKIIFLVFVVFTGYKYPSNPWCIDIDILPYENFSILSKLVCKIMTLLRIQYFNSCNFVWVFICTGYLYQNILWLL